MYPPPHFRASHHLLALSLHLRCLHACLLPPISLPVALDPLSRYPRSTLHVTRLLFTPLTCSRPVPAAPLPVPQVLERIKQGYQYLLPSICVEIFSKEGAAAGEKPYGVVRQRAAGGGSIYCYEHGICCFCLAWVLCARVLAPTRHRCSPWSA